MCLGWGWYLQVDFQLFILGLILLILFKPFPKSIITLSVLMGSASVVYNYIYTIHTNMHIYADVAGISNPESADWFKNVYMTPWGRCTPYLMGLIFGMLFMSFRSSSLFR